MTKKTKQDPSGQSGNRRRARKALMNRLLRARKRIKKVFRAIPKVKRSTTTIQANSETYYEYSLFPGEAETIRAQIQTILNSELETPFDTPPLQWFYSEFAEQPYREGSAEQVIQHNQQVDEAVIAGLVALLLFRRREPVEILRSPEYLRGAQSVLARNYELTSALSRELSTRTSRVLLDAVAAGARPAEVLAQIDHTFDAADSKATRIVNTEVNRAYNNGIIETSVVLAEQVGLTAGVQHISALLPTTRPHHAARHLKYYTTQAQQQWWSEGANRVNCFLPGTRVRGEFSAGVKSKYSGEVIELMTTNGVQLSVTPNHKVMTHRGLISAAEITDSDYLISYAPKAEYLGGVRDLEVDERHPRIEDVFASIAEFGLSSSRRPMSVDFNGDGGGMDEDINIINMERFLAFGFDSSVREILDDFKFIGSNPIVPHAFGAFDLGLNRVFTPSVSGMGGDALSSFFSGSHSAIPSSLSLSKTSAGESDILKSFVDGRARDFVSLSDLIDRHSAFVKSDKVVSTKVSYFTGHVYDLQEKSGLMIADNLIASNCYCKARAVLLDESGRPVNRENNDVTT